ncbi:MAG: tRNA pseudouridine(55) synthase TruB [Nitrospirae bacterium RIFCSPLOWO2_02_FULL_62_14]|nr:MAG: tRNA pseudouridine(55) synthase TruB [Nitrospirae bacterium RIFCSPLOWO2_02_FULL_62_14]
MMDMTAVAETPVAQGVGIGDGILNVNKPAGWTSHDVVAKMRGLLKGPKVGHAGTLDPAATGVLPILVGRGTRIAEYLLEWDKEYRAVLRLGQTTDTQDATGTVLATHSTDGLTDDGIRAAIAPFRGRIVQTPPMYSAVKVAGVPLYKSARAGKTVEREPRTVEIYELDVMDIAGPDVTLRVRCSKGTYVRTLCADIGGALGVGGHLLSLQRTRVGPLTVERSLTPDEIGVRAQTGRLTDDLLPLDAALDMMPVVLVDERTAGRVRHGAAIPAGVGRWASDHRGTPAVVRVKDAAGCLLAVGKVSAEPAESDTVPGVAIEKVLVDVDAVTK